MTKTVRFNSINYSVEKLIAFKGQGTLVDVGDAKVVENPQTATVSDERLKHRLVVCVGGSFIVLVKPEKSSDYANSKVTIITKLVLKKVAAPTLPANDLRPPYVPPMDLQNRYEGRYTGQPRQDSYRARSPQTQPNDNGYGNRNNRGY